MIDLVKSVTLIIQNNPESAVPLYDVLLFMSQPNAALSSEYDETTELLYAMTTHSQENRDLYEKERAAAA